MKHQTCENDKRVNLCQQTPSIFLCFSFFDLGKYQKFTNIWIYEQHCWANSKYHDINLLNINMSYVNRIKSNDRQRIYSIGIHFDDFHSQKANT